MRQKKKVDSLLVSRVALGSISLFLFFQFAACTATRTEDDNTTNTFVKINALRGTDPLQGDDIFSDVCILNMAVPPGCTVTNDNAEVLMSAQPKDLNRVAGLVQDVVFTRYRVTYVRADGRNVPGVDVPHPFDGASTFRLPFDGVEASRIFMVVRPQAKLESPLREMQFGGGAQVLSVLARVDFFGADIAGREIQVTGTLNITFADFNDG